MLKVGVFGATGYTGFETIKILRNHPNVSLEFATSEGSAGKSLSDVYPVGWDIPLTASNDVSLNQVDAVFCCLPHAASMPTVIRARKAGVRVIDLSADFRLRDADTYQQWYGVTHTAPHMLADAVYGIPEINRAEIAHTDLLANPGCYPTSIILALYPLLKANLLSNTAPIIADSKSGERCGAQSQPQIALCGSQRKPFALRHWAQTPTFGRNRASRRNIGRHCGTRHFFAAPGAYQPRDAFHNLCIPREHHHR